MASTDLPPELSFSGNGGSYPPHGTITTNNHGAYVVVTSWIMMCLTVLSVLARLSMRRNLGKDNIAILIASILLIVQSVTIHIAVNHGLGRHMASLSEKNFKAYGKALYTSQIIQILVLCLAKISLVLVFRVLTPSKRMQSTFQLLLTFITLWGVAAIVALALQCRQPHSWNWLSSTCFNQSGLYYANGGVSLVTDIIIIILPAVIIRKAQIKSEQRWAIIAIFSIRVLVCIATIIEIVTFRDYFQSSDRTCGAWGRPEYLGAGNDELEHNHSLYPFNEALLREASIQSSGFIDSDSKWPLSATFNFQRQQRLREEIILGADHLQASCSS